jgi:hypothetical protein
MLHTKITSLLDKLDKAKNSVLVRESNVEPELLGILQSSGLIEYVGLDDYSDCCDCSFGTGCPIERLGGTDDEPEYAAICPKGEIIIYREQDLRLWRITVNNVLKLLAEKLNIKMPAEQLIPAHLWEIGKINSRVRLFLMRDITKNDVIALSSIFNERLKVMRGLVLVPGELPASGILPEQAAAISLNDVVYLDGNKKISINHDLLCKQAEFIAGEKLKVTTIPIEVPANFSWQQVILEFISDEDVRIWTVGEPELKSFADLGFANVRDGSPIKSWQLLWEFAGHEGFFDINHPSTIYPPEKIRQRASIGQLQQSAFSGKLRSALSDLSNKLKELFPGIQGKPFGIYDNRLHQYKSVIRLKWELGYQQKKRNEYRIRM